MTLQATLALKKRAFCGDETLAQMLDGAMFQICSGKLRKDFSKPLKPRNFVLVEARVSAEMQRDGSASLSFYPVPIRLTGQSTFFRLVVSKDEILVGDIGADMGLDDRRLYRGAMLNLCSFHITL
jgi:hypothetical protein